MKRQSMEEYVHELMNRKEKPNAGKNLKGERNGNN